MKYQEMFSLGDNDSRGIILQIIKPHSKVLEFGCATGNMTRYMTEEMGCDVFIVEIEREAFEQAINHARDGVCGDILEYEWVEKFGIKFDYVIFADVLEHLTKPQEVLEKVKEVLAYNGSVVISVPNIAHNDILINLYNNQFNYTPTGLLDDTHVHFFTGSSLRRCCNEAGYQVVYEKNTVMGTGATEQKAMVSSHVLENLLSLHDGGETYQNIVELKTKIYCDENQIKEAVYSPEKKLRHIKVYLDDGNGYSEENVINLEAAKIQNDCYECDENVYLPDQIQKVRIDPIENESCLLLKVELSSPSGEVAYECQNVVEHNGKILLLGCDPQLEVIKLDKIRELNIHIIFTVEGTDSYIEGIKDLSEQITKEVVDAMNVQNNKLDEITGKCTETLKKMEQLDDKVLSGTIDAEKRFNDTLYQLEQRILADKSEVIKSIDNKVSRNADTQKMYRKYSELVEYNRELENIAREESARRQEFEDKFAGLRSELESIKSQLNETEKRADDYRIQLDERSKAAEDYYNRLLERSAAADYWESYVERIQNTKSWKITAPLRIPGHIKKVFFSNNNEKLEENSEGELDIKFSIIMPVYNVDIKWLKKAVDSVFAQTYINWELCIADDASTDKNVIEYLKSLDNNKIKVTFQKKNGGISAASNAAAKMATGQYLLLMDNDDIISNEALMEFYQCVKETDADVLYSDQDIVDTDGNHSCPVCKPDWSPDLLCSQMYLGHLVGFKKELFDEVGGFRKEFDGSQDYDLLLRITEKTKKIEHISKILYSWRSLPSSTASNPDSKPYAQYAGLNAVQEHLDRTLGEGRAKVCETENLFVYDVKYSLGHDILISIIIPTKDHAEDLKIAIDSIFEMSDYQNFEIIILNNNSEEKKTFQYFNELTKLHQNIKIADASYEFNWSKLNNQGISLAKGEVYIFLNNDVKVLTRDWMERLASQALRGEVGAVGAMLLYEDGTIQHGGVVIGFGEWADHAYKGMLPIHNGTPYISPVLTRNVTAVTGACMAISKRTIEEIGVFDENFIICGSDVEICIRAINKGLVNVYDPHIRLYHYESKSRDSYVPQIDFDLSYKLYTPFREMGDPYYNNNLDYSSLVPKMKGETRIDLPDVGDENNITSMPEMEAEKKEEISEEKSEIMLESASDVNEEFMEVNIGEIRPIHFRKVETVRKRLNILLPSLNPEHVFGGIATGYKFFQEMQNKTNMSYRIILVDAEPSDTAFDIYGDEYIFADSQDDTEYNKAIVPFCNRAERTLAVSDKDYFVLTGWWTAYCIQEEYFNWKNRGLTPNPLIYLIQDYEPGFYQWSSMYMFADSTYRTKFKQIAIFNSKELKSYFDFWGYQFDQAYVFDPILNAGLRNYLQSMPRQIKKKKQILVYGRPNTARNAFELVVQALRKWVPIQQNVEQWCILSAGEEHKKVELGKGMVLESVGKLTIEDYARTLQESYAGISLMVSPHPSYPPLEMSVFGVRVITNTYANKDLSSFNDNIISLSSASPDNIAIALKTICDNYQEIKTLDHSRNKEYCCEENSFMFVEELINDLMRG